MDLTLILLVLIIVTLALWIVDEFLLAPKRRLQVADYLAATGDAFDEDEAQRLANGPMALMGVKYGLGAIWAWWLYSTVTQGDMDLGLVLFTLIVMASLTALLDRFYFQPRRQQVAETYTENTTKNSAENVKQALNAEPLPVEYSKSFLPVLLVVFLLRSFLVEPFTIPSGSMIPTLEVGDYILVNKFAYGVRLPVIGTKVLATDEPKPGDVFVFKYPEDPRINYIKRVIGVPGDVIKYENKRLSINGEVLPTRFKMKVPPENPEWRVYEESLEGDNHDIQVSTRYDIGSGEWTVPEGSYFAMGDNRDNSRDSRIWGFVPEKYLVGKAFAVWMHKDPGFSLPSFSAARLIE